MKKRILALLLALSLSLAACTAPAADSYPSPSADPEEIKVDLTKDILEFSAGLSGEETLMTVNGTAVPADFFCYWLVLACKQFKSSYGAYGLSLKNQENSDMVRDEAVNLVASYILMEQKAAELGCPLTDAQLENIQTTIDSSGEDALSIQKSLWGLNETSLRSVLAHHMGHYYNNLLDVCIPATPSDEELNSYAYQTKHILLSTVDLEGGQTILEDGSLGYAPLDEETVAAKRELAEDLLAQIRSSDDIQATFDALMNEYSEDGRDEEGNLSAPDGYVSTPGKMVPEYEQTSFELAIGEVSDIVESTYGYHIILRGEVPDLSSYIVEYRQVQMDALIETWVEEADVVCDDALNAINLNQFYDRFGAYQSDMNAKLNGEKE